MTTLLFVSDALAKGYESDGGNGTGAIIVGVVFGLVFLFFFFSVVFGKNFKDTGEGD